jgi:hypothetical protein
MAGETSSTQTKPFAAFSVIVNILMGTGPIIIPQKYIQGGWLLSFVWVSITAFLSFIGA